MPQPPPPVGRQQGGARMALDADFSDGRITQPGNVGADLADHAVEPGQDDVGTLHPDDVFGNGWRAAQAATGNHDDKMMAARADCHVIWNPQGSVQQAAGICDPPKPGSEIRGQSDASR